MTEYLNEMLQISESMKKHYDASLNIWNHHQPKMLKQMISESIKEVMINICD